MDKIMLELSKLGSRLFRNNVGTGWVGKSSFITKSQVVKVNRGDVVIRKARPLHSGLCVGSSDLIGWTKVKITPDMVGRSVAVFTAVEVKAGKTATTKEQIAFIEAVKRDGGIGSIVRSHDTAIDEVNKWK